MLKVRFVVRAVVGVGSPHVGAFLPGGLNIEATLCLYKMNKPFSFDRTDLITHATALKIGWMERGTPKEQVRV